MTLREMALMAREQINRNDFYEICASGDINSLSGALGELIYRSEGALPAVYLAEDGSIRGVMDYWGVVVTNIKGADL